MRILHLGKYFPPHPGGMETFLGDLSGAQVRAGHQVGCLVHGSQGAATTRDGPTVITARSFGQVVYAPVSPGFPRALHGAVKALNPELIHIHMPNPSAFWLLASPLARRVPWVVHWQSDVVMDSWPRRYRLLYEIYRRPEAALLKRTAAIVATSPGYLDCSPGLQPWRGKCHILPLGINPERLQESDDTAAAWRPQAQLRVLVVGRLSHYKGHEVLLRALGLCDGVEVVIVGTGEREQPLRAQTRELDLGARVVFAGSLPQRQVNRLIDACDVLCLPSIARSEATGLVLMEAMALGKPVIASNLTGSGMPWVVEQAGHGLLAEPGDPVSLAAAMKRMKDPGLREQLGQRGKLALHEHFHIDRIATRLTELYQKIV